MSRKLLLLGSTGSIGRQTLDIVRVFRDRVQVYGLAAGTNLALLREQIDEFRPAAVSVTDPAVTAAELGGIEVLHGEEGMAELAARPDVDLVVVGTTGRAGLLPTLAALEAGKLVALANKETLVMAGPLIRRQLAAGGELVPIDSEHSAIWQCLQGEPERSVERLTLTASGGALRNLSTAELVSVSPEQALRHPTWSMGRKVTIDSATLMNKGLEVIEARWLFDVPMEKIDVVFHPQSIVHSLATFNDSSTKAQLGPPDMRLPIQYALSHPDRWTNNLARLDLAATSTLSFGPIDLGRYPALRLALEAGRQGQTYPAVLSAADEIAVEAFLRGRIRFTEIPVVIERTLEAHSPCRNPELADILGSDIWARETASRLVAAS
jgi:1-deoxy-D-xylulose-5-phosphate reductoisomerase